ncbi:hypothetical protein TNCV_4629841 [Trichonephila clavipes]|nr:hypothetical protein TNCV_4629841 [Trichonephila clavipes]
MLSFFIRPAIQKRIGNLEAHQSPHRRFQSADEVKSASQAELTDMAKMDYKKVSMSFTSDEMKLPVPLINTTNERRLDQGHKTTLLCGKWDIEDISSELDDGG